MRIPLQGFSWMGKAAGTFHGRMYKVAARTFLFWNSRKRRVSLGILSPTRLALRWPPCLGQAIEAWPRHTQPGAAVPHFSAPQNVPRAHQWTRQKLGDEHGG